MGKHGDHIELTRSKLTAAQWRSLNHLVFYGRVAGAPYGWTKTSRECTATVAQSLQRVGAVVYEAKRWSRGPDAGKVVKRVRLSRRGMKLAKMGPPEDIMLPPGRYVWDERGT